MTRKKFFSNFIQIGISSKLMRGDFFTSILKSVTNKFRQNEVQITLKMFYLKLRVNAYETKNTAGNKIEHIFFSFIFE